MMRNISGVRGVFYKYMIRRRSWAKSSGEGGGSRGSSARSAAAGRRTPHARNERTTRTPAHELHCDISQQITIPIRP
ncbi:unnamed protein product [Colias eurytheme]|nr:unnamed protein product [Colias eurytheme]